MTPGDLEVENRELRRDLAAARAAAEQVRQQLSQTERLLAEARSRLAGFAEERDRAVAAAEDARLLADRTLVVGPHASRVETTLLSALAPLCERVVAELSSKIFDLLDFPKQGLYPAITIHFRIAAIKESQIPVVTGHEARRLLCEQLAAGQRAGVVPLLVISYVLGKALSVRVQRCRQDDAARTPDGPGAQP